LLWTLAFAGLGAIVLALVWQLALSLSGKSEPLKKIDRD
jgi:hypothetical protein